MSLFLRIIAVLATILLALTATGLLAFWYIRSENKPQLLARWLLTVLTVLFLVFVVGPTIQRFDWIAAFVGVPMAAAAGVVLAALWAPDIVDWFGKKFIQAIFGADAPPEPAPCYSVAEAHRKAGRYAAAVAEIRKQLEQFPADFPGWMLLAEIQAENLHDLDAATVTIEKLICQPGHHPKNIAFALARLADWQLKYRQDLDAARSTLQRIIDMFPNSPEAHFAHQRIAHLSHQAIRRNGGSPPPIPVPQADQRLGLRTEPTSLRPVAPDVTSKVAQLVAQLEKYPHDNQTREDLAILYAEGFNRVDLAAEQLEQLIAQQHVQDKQIVRWLNLLADLQIKYAGDFDAARQTLRRIIERYPNSPAADQAQRRLAMLALGLRGHQIPPSLSLPPQPDKADSGSAQA